jgi:phosphoribosylcarboxyaminoimidazole (NCAIR) mutase
MDSEAHYLAGLFDGEGHVEPDRYVISNTDDSIIQAACDCLDTLDIHYRTRTRDRHRGHKLVTEIIIHRASARERFVDLVPIRCAAKIKRMAADQRANQLSLAA